jgi:hypothetical protein
MFGRFLDVEAPLGLRAYTSQERAMARAPAGKNPLGKNRVVRPPPSEPLAPPLAETEQPRLARLSAVVAVCFSIGFAWPVFGELNFVQRPPGSSIPKPEEVEPAPSEPDPNTPSAPREVPVMRAAPVTTKEQAVRIESRVVQSCHGDGGEVAARCDAPDLDGVIEAPIARLAACGAASGSSGLLSLGLQLDFARGRVTRVKLGQSTTLAKATASALIRCAEDAVIGTRLDDIEHEHTSYWVYYMLRFLPPGSAVDPDLAPASEAVVSASGRATIGYTTAVVREAPSRRARVTTRLPYGTRLNVNARAGEWYRVEQGGKAIGWLHRKAIGM